MAGRATSGRGANTRARLFTAVARLVAGHDLSEITVDDIAAAAGVAKGTVFYQFGSKSGLFTALLEHGVGELAAALETAVEQSNGAHAVEAVVSAELAYIEQYPAFARLLVSEMWRSDRDWTATMTLLRDRVVAVVAEALSRTQDSGAAPANLDRATAAPAIFGMVAVVALDWRTFHPDRPLADVVAALRPLLPG